MIEQHDMPNLVYVHMGQWIAHLAQMGATKGELKSLFAKGGKASLLDLATIERAHTRYKEEE